MPLDTPLVLLIILLAGSALVRLLALWPAEPPTGAGAVVMAFGIFGLGAQQRIPGVPPVGAQVLAIELLIIWAYIAAAFVTSYRRSTFKRHFADPVGTFAIGTWVAGTAVLARLVYTTLPDWRFVSWALGGVAIATWVAYFALVAARLRTIISRPRQVRVTGRILLTTVSTQSIVLLGVTLLGDLMPWWLGAALISFGYVLYAAGTAVVVYRYLALRRSRLEDDWDNTNCILHGAMSITGLAAVSTGVVAGGIVAATWLWCLGVFILVETVEIVRAWRRVAVYGWRRGLFSYEVSQWARNFTFGMFYAFTLQMASAPRYAQEAAWLRPLQEPVIAFGQYVVLFFLLVETALFLHENLSMRASLRRAPTQ